MARGKEHEWSGGEVPYGLLLQQYGSMYVYVYVIVYLYICKEIVVI